MSYNKEKILDIVIENIPRSCYQGAFAADVSKEDIGKMRLIEDLSLDSLDVHALAADVAYELNIPLDAVYGMHKVETVNDIVSTLVTAQYESQHAKEIHK